MDAWLTRDHAAERAAIDARLAAIDDAVSGLPGVTTEIVAGLDGAPRAYISHRLRVSRLPHALAAAGAGAGSCDGPVLLPLVLFMPMLCSCLCLWPRDWLR